MCINLWYIESKFSFVFYKGSWRSLWARSDQHLTGWEEDEKEENKASKCKPCMKHKTGVLYDLSWKNKILIPSHKLWCRQHPQQSVSERKTAAKGERGLTYCGLVLCFNKAPCVTLRFIHHTWNTTSTKYLLIIMSKHTTGKNVGGAKLRKFLLHDTCLVQTPEFPEGKWSNSFLIYYKAKNKMQDNVPEG